VLDGLKDFFCLHGCATSCNHLGQYRRELGAIVDKNKYKILCSRPYAFRRATLLRTLELLSANNRNDLHGEVQSVLKGPPIEKPQGFHGRPEDDWFLVTLSDEIFTQLVDFFGELEASNVDVEPKTANEMANLLDIWNRKLLAD
jgi:hypothetical protein